MCGDIGLVIGLTVLVGLVICGLVIWLMSGVQTPYSNAGREIYRGCAIFWLLPSINKYKVMVYGRERTDYREIIDGEGNKGIYFASLTHNERCNISVKEIMEGDRGR